MAEAIVTVQKQKEEALAVQQTLLSLCKGTQPGEEAPVAQKKSWTEGMAGLSMFMSVIGEMGTSLSTEDKNILIALQNVQSRLSAVQTTVVDTEDEDHQAGTGAEAGAKSLRTEGTEAPADNQKIQQKKATPGEAKPGSKKEAIESKQNEAGSGSGSNEGAAKPPA